MRLFYAVSVPLEFQKQLAQQVKINWPLEYIEDVSWVKPEQIHLTLRFLGECLPEKLSGLKLAGEITASFFGPFSISIVSFGVFPSLAYPSVLWVGVSFSHDLFNLVNMLEDKLFKEGHPREKRQFKAHITLGRIKIKGKLPRIVHDTVEDILKMKSMELNWDVREFYLIESKLTSSGAIHIPVMKFPLLKS